MSRNCLSFLYLNKTGFNGMYRENQKGEYNIPYGKKVNSRIYIENELKDLSNFLQKVNVRCDDYSYIEYICQSNDLVYFDLPYHNTFNSYSVKKFNEDEQIKLKELSDRLIKKGVNIIISNSDTEFIRHLYKDYHIYNIEVKRKVNLKTANKTITELLIVK